MRAHRPLLLVACLGIAGFFASGVAQAEQQSLIQKAEQAERAGQPKEALDLYKAAIAAKPGPAADRIAQARIAWIEARGEDNFEPLSRLLRLRSLPRGALTREELRSFESSIERLPSGPLRVDSRAFVVGAWLNHINDPAEAERAARAWLQDTFPDKGTQEFATQLLAQALQRQGRAGAALTVLKDHGYRKDAVYLEMRPVLVDQIGRPIALSFLALFALLAAFVLASRWSGQALLRAFRPANLLLLGYTILIPWYIAVRFLSSIDWTFKHAAGYVAAITLVSLLVGATLQERPASKTLTRLVAIAAVLACVGAGFLAFGKSEMMEDLLRWRGI